MTPSAKQGDVSGPCAVKGQMKSTPRPWHREGPVSRDGKSWGNHIAIVGANKWCVSVNPNADIWEADAELICHRVNHFDALVEAARHWSVCDFPDEIDFRCEGCNAARTALALAEETASVPSPTVSSHAPGVSTK